LLVAEDTKKLQGHSGEHSFHPFYERFPDRFSIPIIAKLVISLLLGFLFFGIHYRIVGEGVLADWSWLLCLLIVTAMISLYYATHTFRTLLPQMYARLPQREPEEVDRAYMNNVRHYLSDRRFLWFGLTFAVLNCGVGRFLGIASEQFWAVVTTYVGFFIAGFVCGMALCGVIGVVITLDGFLGREPKVEYTNPDQCGGFLFMGEALIKFSGVILIVGVLISLYIFQVKWVWEGGTAILAPVLMWMWIALPFLMSLTILMAPAARTNKALMNHKIQVEAELVLAFDKARTELENATSAEQKDDLRDEIKFFVELRAQLHRMRIWPFNAQANIKFVILFVSNAFVAIQSIRGLIDSGARIATVLGQ